jgi:hypothetical protein
MLNTSQVDRLGELLAKEGYAYHKSFIEKSLCDEMLEKLSFAIRKCTKEISCSEEDYLKSVSRWIAPSSIVDIVNSTLIDELKSLLELIFQKKVSCQKYGIIAKTPFYTHPTICHQDLSYSIRNPYSISGWIPLNDVDESTGALMMQKFSHRNKLAKPADYWAEDFVDEHCTSLEWKRNSCVVPASAGDLIMFDSRIWHGSTENSSAKNRYAIFVRLEVEGWYYDSAEFAWENFNQSDLTIRHFFFAVLDLLVYFLISLEGGEYKKDYNKYEVVIDSFIKHLQNNDKLSFIRNRGSAIHALENFKITNLARIKHNGEDSTGYTYKILKENLINPILQHYKIHTN